MMALLSVSVFLFGLIAGSFLNAVMYRLEVEDSPFRGRSYCPHCKHELSWQDLIPLVSFAMLGGKCRYCSERISLQYPLVELGTGIVFVLIFWHLDFGFDLAFGLWHLAFLEPLYFFAIASLLIILFVHDLRHYILPDKILLAAIGITGIWYAAWDMWGAYPPYAILHTLYAALGATVFFLAIFLLSRGRAMGFGDVKLALFMGLFLGWPNILVALFVAFLGGAIIGIILIVLQKKKLKSEIPFGPFLIAGTFVALFVGENIINWYLFDFSLLFP